MAPKTLKISVRLVLPTKPGGLFHHNPIRHLNSCLMGEVAHILAQEDHQVIGAGFIYCARLLMEKTGYKLVDRSDEPPYIYSYSTLVLIYQSALDRALGVEQTEKLEDAITVDTESGVLWYNQKKLAEAPGEEERCKTNILAALKEGLESGEAKKVEPTYKELAETTMKARRAIEEILLMELVPGECRVCHRLGT